jgi:hypothetical protein
MSNHEQKQCERCNLFFECTPLNISACQCSDIQLNNIERAYIKQRYADCLCLNCLNQLKQEYYTQQINEKIKHTPLG